VSGCLFGGAVGDALGAPVEFLDLPAIIRRYGPQGIAHYDLAYGRRGAITDDTQMTLFTAEGVPALWPTAQRLPFGLAATQRPLRTDNPSGYYSAGCLAAIVCRLRQGQSLADAIQGTLQPLKNGNPGHEECARAIEGAVALWRQRPAGLPSADVSRLGAGWVGEEALAISLYCALQADGDFTRGVLLAVNHRIESRCQSTSRPLAASLDSSHGWTFRPAKSPRAASIPS
jgi:ADP-ribosylglycohydrolase